LIQPGGDDIKGLVDTERAQKNTWQRGESQDRKDHIPRNADNIGCRQDALWPDLGIIVLQGIIVDCVKQKIGIENHQLCIESLRTNSSSSRASAAVSALSHRNF
jgi:hypothetical protein